MPGSAQPSVIEPLREPQEHTLPRVPGQQPIHQPTAAPDDLAGHLELPTVMRRHEAGEARVLPVIVRDILWR
jgi:hypothetical protein